MNILITGASGFLGQYLIRSLLMNTNHFIIALSSHTQELKKYTDLFHERISVVETYAFSALPFSTIDILVNCAFPMKADGVQMAKGLSFISELLKASCKNGVGAVINISSQSVYSTKRQEPATEESELDLESDYGMGGYAVGKYAAELLTNSICSEIPHMNLRLASLIGAGYDQRVTNKLIDKVLAGETLTILTGNQIYSYLDVRDAVSAIIAVSNSDTKTWKEIYNLGSGESYTLEDIAHIVCDLYYKFYETKINYKTQFSEKTCNFSLDIKRIERDFSWHPRYSLYESLKWICESKIIL